MECCLSKGELIRLDGGTGGLVLRCTHGSVWLTCGDGADYLLSAGRNFELSARGNAVVEALEPVEFCLAEPAAKGKFVQRQILGFSVCQLPL